MYVLKEVISSRSPVYEDLLDHVASLVPYYEEKLCAVEKLLENHQKPKPSNQKL